MTYDSLVNRGDYFSAHYLAEVLPKDLKSGLLQAWKEREEAAKPPAWGAAAPEADVLATAVPGGGELPVTPRAGLRELRRDYFRARSFFALPEDEDGIPAVRDTDDDTLTYHAPLWRERVQVLNAEVLRALGYDAKPRTLTVERAGQTYEIPVAHAEKGLVAVDCGWAAEPDAALDPKGRGRLLEPVPLDGPAPVETGSKLASFLFACEEVDGDRPPRYVLLLGGGVIVLADRAVWGEGRYLGVSLDTALQRNDTRAGGELDTVAALFGADSLRTPEEGGENPLAELVGKSAKHAVGVSSELRDGLRKSVELIANEVLERLREQGLHPEDIGELPELGRRLTRESLRYLYRILFLLYAEARPELGILPADYPEYQQGYGLGRLAELIADREPISDTARNGFYLYESLDLLFGKVQDGYRPRRTHGVDMPPVDLDAKTSEDVGLRFEPLKSKLFERDAIRLIGDDSLPDPRHDSDEALARGESVRHLDTRLRNATLHQVLHSLMITRGKRGERGGFISYAQLGINQLGAVYEGLMSYSGFIAGEELYEVAKGGDPKDGSWLVPKSKIDEYPESVFVRRRDRHTGEDVRMRYAPGSFVYRLSGRDRQTSASYYTPESLTKVTVQLALQQLLTEETEAKELLNWRICEPALGSGAFLNEAINQVSAEYLRRRQSELGRSIDTEQYAVELQKAKAYIALHNSYGVDLNETAVELAEVSLWLNTMHPGMEAPWFGLHLRRGNSLIGGRREVYDADRLKKGGWLGTTPERFALADAVGGATLPEGSVHHFLLPAKEWGAVAAEKEARALAPEAAKALGAWRKAITKSPTARQTARLQGLARRAEYLWELVVRRLELSERDISRHIRVWGAEGDWLRQPEVVVERDEVLADLQAEDTPYWRLKTLMDTWCALWFWPVQGAALLDGTDERYARAEALAERAAEFESAGVSAAAGEAGAGDSGVLMAWDVDALPGFEAEPQQMTLTRDSVSRRRTGRRAEQVKGQRREVIPLAALEDWLDFAEALLGTQDVPSESLVSTFETLDDLSVYEDELPEWMGMERFQWLENRFLWAGMAKDVAKAQGFFHWELEFAQVFARGGFDLQVGNPPWVRPRWQEDLVLAEVDPWFALSEKPTSEEWRLRKHETLSSSNRYYLHELSSNFGAVSTLGSAALYPILAGTQPDLYRAFMCKAWNNSNETGISGLIHPDTHFGGTKEGYLRSATYKHLRLHAHFSNRLLLFTDIEWTRQFGVHIYGHRRDILFHNASWIFTPDTLTRSLSLEVDDGPIPGIKYKGKWDIRPHRSRIIEVSDDLLKHWRSLTAQDETPIDHTPLLYPVTSAEQGAIDALATHPHRISIDRTSISSGLNEKSARDAGTIRWQQERPHHATDVVLQGAHIGVANPFYKCPKIPCRSVQDWLPVDLTKAQIDETQRTNYKKVKKTEEVDSPHFGMYRLAWRKMISFDGDRSLFASIIPPGVMHVDGIYSMALASNRETILHSGFWAGIPMDYLLRITGKANLHPAEVNGMPAPELNHPLTEALLVRTLLLNCLTDAYAPLWAEQFHASWPHHEGWAREWPNASPLSQHLNPDWEYDTPLRSEYERRAALVEIDALVSVWLGITADQLVAICKSRYPVLSDYESEMYFDARRRKITANHRAQGHGQSKETYTELMAHLETPQNVAPPEGYESPFYKADRETELREAHKYFQERLDTEIAARRWTPPRQEGTAR
ncbi:Eco57I restriction-modification methylase domain-containing protein [Streptomyces europaeiscabiei]|uniref:Eco57I restriction-modification methylase domain-containing protein n=1 Tax=Streptomyces europaeiscabiei TaxID=146819 RepID=UPI0007660D5A|nr:DNA methyltransferase [Streptomyces europaeiscabiei]MDX3666349.1 class I SAM-dependent DNA methyltransferase [Streptomyces europaeiscabiei]MDX3840787.1 class I SAM-dependent DNA methyltransferase [Streptomyces europaeiscabiei]